MKIVVTGASGFVGGHIIRSLATIHNITALSRRPIPEATKYNWLQTDIVQPFTIDGDTDILVHAAAVADLQAPLEISEQVNTIGTKNTLNAAKKASVKHFIFISTASIYDAGQNKCRVTEDFAKASGKNNYYSRTKYAAEQLVLNSKLNATILRPHCIYGPCDTTILPGLFRNIRRSRLYLPIAEPKEISTTYIGNLCAVIEQIVQRMPSGIHTYNVADKGYVMNVDFVESLLSLLDGCKIKRIPPGLAKLILQIIPLLSIDKAIINQLNEDSSLDINRIKNDKYSLPYSRKAGLNHLKKWYISSEDYADKKAQTDEVWPSYKNSPTYSFF